MLSHRIRPVSEILAPYVEHLWVVRGYLPARWRNSIQLFNDGKRWWIVNIYWQQESAENSIPEKYLK